MTTTFKVFCLSEAIGPVTHMSRVEGNESIVAREPLVTPQGILWVPFLSGNAMRHRCVRRPGARWLVERLGLRGKLTLPQLNFLFHGGNLTESGGREDTRAIADWQQLFPLGRLLGGSLPGQILSGSLLAGRGTLICEENRSCVSAQLPEGWELPPEPFRPAESFVSGYQYVRSDAVKSVPDLMQPPAPGIVLMDDEPVRERGAAADGKSNQMIFSGQAVTRGAMFVHVFTLAHVSRLELGALLLSLALWQEEGGTVGGQSARGHGRLKMRTFTDGDDGCVDEYVAHVDASADGCREWLAKQFGARTEKPKKGKQKAVAASE